MMYGNNPKAETEDWRDFRLQLDDVDYEEDCLQAVVDWWKHAPVGSRELDIYDTELFMDLGNSSTTIC